MVITAREAAFMTHEIEEVRVPELPGDESEACRLHEQALLCLDEGRYDEAERLQLRALAIAEERLGPDHLDVASILNGLGVIHKYQGRYAEAEPLYRRALGIVDAVLGHDHLEAAGLYHNLGGLEHARPGGGGRGARALGPEDPRARAGARSSGRGRRQGRPGGDPRRSGPL